MNTKMAEADVTALCRKAGVEISAIEALPAGGTHLVCATSAGSDIMREKLRTHLIEGTVKRYPFYKARGPW
jgi:hypothetical protein